MYEGRPAEDRRDRNAPTTTTATPSPPPPPATTPAAAPTLLQHHPTVLVISPNWFFRDVGATLNKFCGEKEVDQVLCFIRTGELP
ncbi:hypothetical protein RB195_016972 [Necator americanus]|uniref:Uncharacterized protein n=1 Tax=Necator americanus TaxID=51031 RepID=A0ABR1C653_NECAM